MVKYQPPLYLALKDAGRESMQTEKKDHFVDSLRQLRGKLMTFIMTIGLDKSLSQRSARSSVMSEGINGYQEYVQRVLSTNFFMEQYISLYVDGVEY
jgi:hypothetical protein